ncbi:MAG: sensor histidine kinase [Ilumatobacteraceae bacterium]
MKPAPRLPWLPWLLVAVGITWAWLATRQQQRAGRPLTFLVSDVVPGLVMIAAGLLIRSRRPQNRCWWLLVAASFAWYVGDFEHSTNDDVVLGAFAFGGWYGLFLGWAVLAFPSGRLQHHRDKVLVAALFALLAARSVSRVFLHVRPDFAGYGVENRFLPISDDRWWRMVEDVFAWGYAATMLGLLVSVADRWLRSSRPGRRMVSPALSAATALAAAVAYEYAIGWNADVPVATGLPIYYVVWWAYAAVALALVIGLLRLRGTRSAVVDLVAELGHDAPPARLGDALGRALGDASLTLLPWSAAAESYVDDRARPVQLPVDQPNRAITRIERRGGPVAALVHDIALLEDPGLVNAIVAAVRLTVDNEQLQAEIETQLAEVAASRSRIVAAGDAERRRIERDLHDGAQQRLVTIALALRLAETRLDGDASPRVRAVLSQAVQDLGDAIDELRNLARGIHPAILSESGLGAAIESLVSRSPLPVRLDIDLADEPSSAIAAAAYFAVSEALTNVVKHANAQDVTVRAVASDGMIRVEVIDDGDGGANAHGGSGLRGVADRVASVGGTLRLHSPAAGGTRVEVELPCALS